MLDVVMKNVENGRMREMESQSFPLQLLVQLTYQGMAALRAEISDLTPDSRTRMTRKQREQTVASQQQRESFGSAER